MFIEDLKKQSRDYHRIEQVLHNIEATAVQQPDLRMLAAKLKLSEFHFQRLFSRWAGVSPKRFLQFLTLDHAKLALAKSESLLDVTFETGLSSVSRLHDLFLQCEAMSPGEYKNRGQGLTISYGMHPSPFGQCLIATTSRGICWFRFIQEGHRPEALEVLHHQWAKAKIKNDATSTSPYLARIFNPVKIYRKPLYLLVKGTNFQMKVWEALIRIPQGGMVSYQQVARQLGMPNGSRAVANAVAANPIQYMIPCHRVIQSLGTFGGYQAGHERKKALLAWEAARAS